VKAAELQNLFGVQSSFANAELAGAERVPVFVSSPETYFPSFGGCRVVEIDSERSRRGEPTRHVDAPESRRVVVSSNAPEILRGPREKCGRLPIEVAE